MKKIIIIFIILMVAFGLLIFSDEPERYYKDSDFMDTIKIASLDRALTFARVEIDGKIQLLLVRSYIQDEITAVNATTMFGEEFTDPVTLFNQLGYTKIKQHVHSITEKELVIVNVAQLIIPLELRSSHIATGTNFAAHAEEAAVEEGPFLFAKLVTPTPFQASASAGEGLLDYEVELAFVTLTNIELPEMPEFMGLILANDLTDRAKLMRNLNPDDVTSGDGFTTGKSAPGYLPVGNLFVIPYDLQGFVDGIELKLAVNEKLRQVGNMTQLIWDIKEILKQAERKQNTRWMFKHKEITLPVEKGIIPDRTMIISGTPDGTIFTGVPKKNMVTGLLSWLFGGWDKSVKHHVIEKYIESAKHSDIYLQKGDNIKIQVEELGIIETGVVE